MSASTLLGVLGQIRGVIEHSRGGKIAYPVKDRLRNLGQRGQEQYPLQQLIPLTPRLGHIREYPPGRALPLQSRR